MMAGMAEEVGWDDERNGGRDGMDDGMMAGMAEKMGWDDGRDGGRNGMR